MRLLRLSRTNRVFGAVRRNHFAAAVVCILLLDGSLTATARADEPDERFRVMSWNLEWFYDDEDGDNYSKLAKEQSAPSRSDWNWKRDGIAEAIAEAAPDVVAVQEIENRRVLWYLSRAIQREHEQDYIELALEGRDFFTEQDVGFLFQRQSTDFRTQGLRNLSRTQRTDDRFADLSKHMIVQFETSFGDAVETVWVINVHLRAREEAAELRKAQARTLHSWVRDLITAGENVIVLGDLNTEHRGDQLSADIDVGVVAGKETTAIEDDLIDVTLSVPPGSRVTHVLPDRRFDRILVSRTLIEDDPTRLDLVFDSFEVLPRLAVRGPADTPEDHWDDYWQRDAATRDLSDHYPIIADFVWR